MLGFVPKRLYSRISQHLLNSVQLKESEIELASTASKIERENCACI